MKRLTNEQWKIVLANVEETGEEIEVTWLDAVPFDKNGNPTGEVYEWVLNVDCELLEDGFQTEEEAYERLREVEKLVDDSQ